MVMIEKQQNNISKSVYVHISLTKSHSIIKLEEKTLKANKSVDRVVWVDFFS